MKSIFDKHRKGDINLEIGIADKRTSMDFYILGKNSTMNTFSMENLERLGLQGEVKEIKKIDVYPLFEILEKYPFINDIHYLNIDVEGLEVEILSGLKELRPWLISIEQNGVKTLEDVLQSETAKYLNTLNYKPVAKNIILKEVATVFYIKCELLS